MSESLSIILDALTTLRKGQESAAARLESVTAGQESAAVRLDSVTAGLEGVTVRLDSVTAGQERLEARVTAIGARIDVVRTEFLAELGRTRADVMARLQNVRDDVTVNLVAAQLAERGARDAIDQGRTLTDLLYALTRQVRQLQDAVDILRNGKAPLA